MKRYFPVLVIGLLCGLLLLVGCRDSSKSVADEETASTEETASNKALLKEQQVEQEKTMERVKELGKMELKKRQRDQAAEKTQSVRAQLQFSKQSAWTKVIQAHRQEFEALRAQAAESPDKVVPCTICDGKGVLDLCVVCDHTGKCPTFHGTGKVFGEVCPTCLGSGKCFLCSGTGKMPCPFCLDGVITPDTPDPPTEIPIN